MCDMAFSPSFYTQLQFMQVVTAMVRSGKLDALFELEGHSDSKLGGDLFDFTGDSGGECVYVDDVIPADTRTDCSR